MHSHLLTFLRTYFLTFADFAESSSMRQLEAMREQLLGMLVRVSGRRSRRGKLLADGRPHGTPPRAQQAMNLFELLTIALLPTFTTALEALTVDGNPHDAPNAWTALTRMSPQIPHRAQRRPCPKRSRHLLRPSSQMAAALPLRRWCPDRSHGMRSYGR